MLAAWVWLFAPIGVAFGLEMIKIPAGDFIMGSNKKPPDRAWQDYGNRKPWYLDEHPEHRSRLPDYYISKFEITNAEYLSFVKQTGHRIPDGWIINGYILAIKKAQLNSIPLDRLRNVVSETGFQSADVSRLDKASLLALIERQLEKLDKLPVTHVNWQDAQQFCHFHEMRLPTEAEWEKAARGDRGNEFPWGNEWNAAYANTGRNGVRGIAAVGTFKNDVSRFGVYDMAGNVQEWVEDWYQAYPGSDYQDSNFGKKYHVVRGAGYIGEGHYDLEIFFRSAFRFQLLPDAKKNGLGFRCAKDAAH